jgi:hypothetical protein
MASILKKISLGILIALFIYVGLQTFIKTMVHFDNSAKYELIEPSGQINTVYIVPINLMIIKKQVKEKYEYGIFKITGENAVHYFGSIYNSGETLLGLRIYSNAIDVWKSKMELINKKGNLEYTTFHEIGETYKEMIIFKDNSVEIGKYKYNKVNLSQEDEQFINEVINVSK